VRRFRNILLVVTALLWLPASAHCQLEFLSGLEFLQCETQAPSSHNPNEDCSNCCAVEKSQCRVEHERLTIPAPVLLPAPFAPVLSTTAALPAEVSPDLRTLAPPELPQRWHFLTRTAPPARAPSLAS
jgi:hypothetical protein